MRKRLHPIVLQDLWDAPLYECVRGSVFRDWSAPVGGQGFADVEINRSLPGLGVPTGGVIAWDEDDEFDQVLVLDRIALGFVAVKMQASDLRIIYRSGRVPELPTTLFVTFPRAQIHCAADVIGEWPGEPVTMIGEGHALIDRAPYYVPLRGYVLAGYEQPGRYFMRDRRPRADVQSEIALQLQSRGIVPPQEGWYSPVNVDTPNRPSSQLAAAVVALADRNLLVRIPKVYDDPLMAEFYWLDSSIQRFPLSDCWPARQHEEAILSAPAELTELEPGFVSPYPPEPPPRYVGRPRLPRTTTDWPTIRAYRKRGLREGYDYNNNPMQPRLWVIVDAPGMRREFAYEDWAARSHVHAPSVRAAAEDVLRAMMPQTGVRVLASDTNTVVRLTEADWERHARAGGPHG